MLFLENMEVWRAVRFEINSRNGKTVIFTDFFRVRSISYSTLFPLPYEYDYSQKVKLWQLNICSYVANVSYDNTHEY